MIFRYGNSELTHTFNVDGYPQNNEQVRKGPDWRPELEQRVKNQQHTQQHYQLQNYSCQSQPFYHLQGGTSLSDQLGHVCAVTRLQLGAGVVGGLQLGADLGGGGGGIVFSGGGLFGDSPYYAGQDAEKGYGDCFR